MTRMCPKQRIPRVLVVEDDPDQLDLIRESLRAHYGPASAGGIIGVRSAGECLSEKLSRFDVVLQDLNLPDMPGLELLAELIRRADVPVVVVTGHNDSGTAAEAIARGAQDYVVKLGDYLLTIPVLVEKAIDQHRLRRENVRLQRRLEEMLNELRLRNAELQVSLDEQRRMATTDGLTGLSNRRRFDELLHKRFYEASRYGFDLSCCMCDLDCYKQLNDTFGHQVGDHVLAEAAGVIRASLRKVDVAGRYGGDEFVLLLPHTSLEWAMRVTDRIRSRISSATAPICDGRGVTVSMGVASLRSDQPRDADHLLSMADRALYLAKQRGRDRVVAFGQVRHVA